MKVTDEVMKQARSELGRIGGSVKCKKGLSCERVLKKSIKTRKLKAKKARMERIERACIASVRAMTTITGDELMSILILEAIRKKRVCHLRFKVV